MKKALIVIMIIVLALFALKSFNKNRWKPFPETVAAITQGLEREIPPGNTTTKVIAPDISGQAFSQTSLMPTLLTWEVVDGVYHNQYNWVVFDYSGELLRLKHMHVFFSYISGLEDKRVMMPVDNPALDFCRRYNIFVPRSYDSKTIDLLVSAADANAKGSLNMKNFVDTALENYGVDAELQFYGDKK